MGFFLHVLTAKVQFFRQICKLFDIKSSPSINSDEGTAQKQYNEKSFTPRV